VFGEKREDGMIVKRLADDSGSSSDDDKRPNKMLKVLSTNAKATDILAGPSSSTDGSGQPLRKKINLLIKPKSAVSKAAPVTVPQSLTAAVKPALGGLSLLGSYSDSSSQSDSDNN
jgi:hypothetical protein